MALANNTVAMRAQIGSRTAQRALSVLGDLDFLVTVVGGRYLTDRERQAARAHHGGRQVRASSVRALTVPKPCSSAGDIGDLSRRDSFNLSANEYLYSPKRASARSKAASRQHRRKTTKPTSPKPALPLRIQKTAADLIQRLPWLYGRGVTTRSVGGVLTRLDIDCGVWSGRDILDCLETWHAKHRWNPPQTVKSPMAWLTVLLKRAMGAAEKLGWQTEAERSRAWHERAAARANAAPEPTPELSEETKRMVAEAKAKLKASIPRLARG